MSCTASGSSRWVHQGPTIGKHKDGDPLDNTLNGSTPASTRLHFTNCVIPNGSDITIPIPPRLLSSGVISSNSVYIEVVNTTMQGGSFQIVPHSNEATDPTPPPPPAVLSLQNIYISAEHAVLHGAGDVLVVKTPTTAAPAVMLVEDVRFALQNVVLTSSTGSVASIITTTVGGDNNSELADAVTRSHIYIGGNSTMDAKLLVGSVQTSRLTNSTLVATNTLLHGGGPIHLVAGGDTVEGHVGVLSVLSSNGPDSTVLHVEDVQILAQYGSCPRSTYTSSLQNSLFHLKATANVGIAAIASIAARHRHLVNLTMTGSVLIELNALGDTDGAMDTFSSASSQGHSMPLRIRTLGLLQWAVSRFWATTKKAPPPPLNSRFRAAHCGCCLLPRLRTPP